MKTQALHSLLPQSKLRFAGVVTLVVAALGAELLLFPQNDQHDSRSQTGERETAQRKMLSPRPAPGSSQNRERRSQSSPIKSAPARAAELATRGETAVPELSAALASASTASQKAVYADALALIGSAQAVNQILARALGEPDPGLRREIASSLDALSNPEGLAVLPAALAETSDPVVLDALVAALSRGAGRSELDQLVDQYRHDPIVRTQRTAILQTLSGIRNPAAIRTLAAIARTAREPGLVEAAARGLSKIGSATAAQALVDSLHRTDTADPSLRASLLNLITRVDNPEGLAVLQQLDGYFNENDDEGGDRNAPGTGNL